MRNKDIIWSGVSGDLLADLCTDNDNHDTHDSKDDAQVQQQNAARHSTRVGALVAATGIIKGYIGG